MTSHDAETMSVDRARALLGLPIDFDREQLKTAFRARARQTHPDKNSNSNAITHDFVSMTRARDVLENALETRTTVGDIYQLTTTIRRRSPPRKSATMKSRRAPAPPPSKQQSTMTSPQRTFVPRREYNFDVGGANDKTPNIELTLEELCSGTSRTVNVPVSFPCLDCLNNFCSVHTIIARGGAAQRNKSCVGGVGGTYVHNVDFIVNVPAGVPEGHVVRQTAYVPAASVSDKANRVTIERSGFVPHYRVTAAVVVCDAQHELYARDSNNNLHCHLEIPLVDALLGIEVELKTPNDRVVSMITSPGHVVRGSSEIVLENEGMPLFGNAGSKKRGDLIVKVNVDFPHTYDTSRVDELRQLKTILSSVYQRKNLQDDCDFETVCVSVDEHARRRKRCCRRQGEQDDDNDAVAEPTKKRQCSGAAAAKKVVCIELLSSDDEEPLDVERKPPIERPASTTPKQIMTSSALSMYSDTAHPPSVQTTVVC